MRNVSLWARVLGVEHSAVSRRSVTIRMLMVWLLRCGRRRGTGIVAGTVSAARPGRTRVRDCAGGGRWMRAR